MVGRLVVGLDSPQPVPGGVGLAPRALPKNAAEGRRQEGAAEEADAEVSGG